MDKAHPLSSPIVVCSLDVKNNPFFPCENGEKLLGAKVPYLSVVNALMYLANYTSPYIVFFYQFISKYSFALTQRHGNGIKHMLHYLQRTIDMSYFA